jgi:dTDP-4-amino-4,6-dideoxygalactose transaminase
VTDPPPVRFVDLRGDEDAPAVRAAIERVVARGWYVLGPEVEAFESEFAQACGARYAVGVGNGTDAIALLLRAAGIGRDDEVVVPAMTAAFTALAVIAAGARPIFADVDPGTLTLDPAALSSAITPRTRAVVPVHLYGQAAEMPAIREIASRHALAVIEDCCQAHLATTGGIPVGTIGAGGAFSFYPTKNLGALGDGGAVITNDRAVADRVRRLRNGGQADRYNHVEAGVNSRLDEMQAAVLRARLPHLARATARRRDLAGRYRRRLPRSIETIRERDPGHVYHLFPVRSSRRDALQASLASSRIETLIHYPVSLTDQPAFAPYAPLPCPVATEAARTLLSLPLTARLTDADVDRVASVVAEFEKGHVPA